MLTELEITEIKERGKNLSNKLSKKLEQFLAVDECSGKEKICCEYYDRGQLRTRKISRKACEIALGEVVDDVECE